MRGPSAPATAPAGLGLRRAYWDDLLAAPDGRVDFLELIPENVMRFGGRVRDVVTRAAARWPIVFHGTTLSLGGPDPLDERYLDDLAALAAWLDPPWISDHLSIAGAHGRRYFDLLPLPFTEEAIAHVVARIRHVQDCVRRPVLIENPSYYVRWPGAEMDEATFVREVVTRADCGLLLDVNNVFVNATNHGYDPVAFIDAMPAARVRQLHVAGHEARPGLLVDTHGAPLAPAVHALLAHTYRHVGAVHTLLEWDHDVPALGEVLGELDRVRATADAALQQPEAA